jgi:hypothetical protein
MELGIITPQQGMEMFHTGQFPKAEEIAPAQEGFVKEREDGYYNPIVGGVPVIAPPKDPNANKATINQTNKVAGRPEGTTGIPITKANFSIKNIQAVIKNIEAVKANMEKELKSKLNLKKLNNQQHEMLEQLSHSIAVSKELNCWEDTAYSCVNNFDEIASLSTIPEVLEIASEHQIEDDYSAALLYHSQKINEN